MLPIHEIHDEFLKGLSPQNAGGIVRLILQAPTGSGKSTQIPQMLLDAGRIPDGRQIVVMQPRRIAAKMLARRVASERGGTVGDEIGYQVRLDRKTGSRTRVRYVTEGILLREWLREPDLPHVGCLIFDEFHERHLYGDLSLAQALRLQATSRPDLLIILMSATLDTTPLQKFLPDATLLRSEGRTYPVDIHYLDRDPRATQTDIWQSAATTAERMATLTDGDLLIFMPGRYEIDRTLDALGRTAVGKTADCLPLHGDLSPADQDRALSPSPRRRIIVSTNIAETSLTIDGVRGVIDSGLARVARFDPARGVDQLEIEAISQSAADQRAGRAGRTAPGVCVRLWTQAGHANRPPRDTPEIHRVDLSEAVLTLRALGIHDWSTLALPDPPDESVLRRTESFLYDLGATDAQGHITEMGRRMLDYPAHPRTARLMLEAEARGVHEEAAVLAGILQGRPVFQHKVGTRVRQARMDLYSGDGSSDLLMQIRACVSAAHSRFARSICDEIGLHAGSARQAIQIATQFTRIGERHAEEADTREPADIALRKCIAVAFADRLALRRDRNTRRCDLVDGRVAELDADSVCTEAELLVAAEVRDFARAKVPILLGVTRVEPEWLQEFWPEHFSEHSETRYDEQSKRVLTEHRRTFGQLVLHSKIDHEVSDDDAGRLLADAVEAGQVPLPGWDESVDRWITRLNCLAAWRPDWELPPITPEDRRTLLEHMLSGCRTRKDVKTFDVRAHIESWLSPMQLDLVRDHTPERIDLPCGRKARVRYEEGSPPVISSMIQDFFGMTEAPKVAGDTVPCRVELLAPNRRPAQLTDDLKSFWANGYPLLRKELKGRYPKHNWPESISGCV
ncbi:MAG: ATP-dependent helicase HrpB [Kiritimatiellae bacterium]|nr:ATP-dependent helicase HrpB [Kiritimatiellia bacterium]